MAPVGMLARGQWAQWRETIARDGETLPVGAMAGCQWARWRGTSWRVGEAPVGARGWCEWP